MRNSGYHINVAKLPPRELLSTWDKQHGSGHMHYFNAELGHVDMTTANKLYDEFYVKFPPTEGYHLTLIYVPSSSTTLRRSHIQDGDRTRIAAEVGDERGVRDDGEVA